MSNLQPFRVVIGRNVNAERGFQVFSGDVDLTDRLSVKSFALRVDADSAPTRAHLEVYVDEVELALDPEHLRVDGVVLERSRLREVGILERIASKLRDALRAWRARPLRSDIRANVALSPDGREIVYFGDVVLPPGFTERPTP